MHNFWNWYMDSHLTDDALFSHPAEVKCSNRHHSPQACLPFKASADSQITNLSVLVWLVDNRQSGCVYKWLTNGKLDQKHKINLISTNQTCMACWTPWLWCCEILGSITNRKVTKTLRLGILPINKCAGKKKEEKTTAEHKMIETW